MKEKDVELLRRAFAAAGEAAAKGNPPLGAVLVNAEGEVILESGDSIHSDGDPLSHAAVNLIRGACRQFSPETLRTCTIYVSAEPCPMCAAAVYWSGVRRLVFGLSRQRLHDLNSFERGGDFLDMSARLVLESGSRRVLVTGPLLEREAAAIAGAT